jgi:glycosyltransferase involved in cell wall biosynthesis
VRSGVRVEQLARLPNVYLLGKKHWYSLPAYLRRFDVCISPFRTDQSIAATANPLKIYEYLAAGKPIVSSDMPEVRPLRDVIRIAGDTATFIEATGQALEASRRGDSAAVAARMNRARAYDWDALLTGMSAHISHQLTLASGASRVPAARSGALAG